ncbi:quinoprotein relay system zinc metallohydrolase 1 [Croceicoccus gelatinilyticus]|uniref:quinoprotein relay system zinc metallohydrolase 1 n=1 Tax=Croceicoccus gelatinilyticus TaxID=2835536 RepID=UPI001BCDB39E|nr:quinoprotein relay system zinc metallohydrolase 1 [Croceicoccus gelatinilyticus]MBS7669964.1 quinoprotein relay system zinc metallohydrolase 1 [Croceicoccus gelatinilyticus]
MRLSRRTMFAGLGLAGVGLAGLAPALVYAEQFAGTYNPQAEEVADGIWMVRGADEPIAFANGGAIANTVIIATNDGTIVVDPGPSLSYGKAIRALAESVTGKPVIRVYITHLHPDHSFGAGAFDAGIVHALSATRHDLERDGEGFSDALFRVLADWMKGTTVVLPQGDVTAGKTVIGGRKLQLFALGGHSSGDLAILDEATGTLIGGDLVFHDRAPATPHANIDGWLSALDTLEGVPHKLVIPGHGPIDSGNVAIPQTRDWLSWLDSMLNEAVLSGMDMTEAGATEIPARFANIKVARYELQRSVSHFYPGLEAELLPMVGS